MAGQRREHKVFAEEGLLKPELALGPGAQPKTNTESEMRRYVFTGKPKHDFCGPANPPNQLVLLLKPSVA